MQRIVYVVFVLALLASCGPDLPEDLQELNKLEKELELQPSPERAISFLNKNIEYVNNHIDDYELIKPQLLKGLSISKEQGMLSRAAGFLFPLLQNDQESEQFFSYAMDLGDVMYALNKKHVSNVVYKTLLAKNPNNSEIVSKSRLIDSSALADDAYMQHLLEQIVVDPDEFGINKAAALKFVDAAEAFALVDPDNSLVPEYLYRAAEAARSRRDFAKALTIYDWLIADYPDHERAPTALFIKGFTIEQDLKRDEDARPIYEEFIAKYPDHQMRASVDFLLENLGKSESEILEVLQSKQSDQTQ